MILTPIFDAFRQNISYRITAVAALPALLFLSIVGGGAYWQMYGNAYDQLVSSIDLNADNQVRRLGATLNTIETTLQTLSENSMIANGLIDSAGRETYLIPLLEGFSAIDGIHIDVGLSDFLGETIAFSGQFNPFVAYKNDVALAIENGTSAHTIIHKDGQRFLLGIDVLVYSRTGSGEGALVYLVNVDEIFELHVNTNPLFEMRLLQAGVGGPQNANYQMPHKVADKIIATHPVPVVEELLQLGLTIETTTDAQKAFQPLQQISSLFVIGCVVIFMLVLILSLWLGRQLTRPLQHLKTVVDNASLDAAVPLGELMNRQDEVGSLASSFNKIFTSLQSLNLTLEEKIQEKTREHQLAKNEAERASKAKSEFLSSMSHDLRTPLNAIIGFSDMMRAKTFGPLGNAHYDAYADDIYNSGEHLISLINDILDLSKIEAGKYDLVEQPLDVSVLIQACFRQVKNMADTSGLTLTATVAPDLPHLRGDKRVLTQILNNLLSNAIKFTEDGGKIAVTAKVDESNGIAISVEDTGIGMSKEGIDKALRPFEQADTTHSRNHEGTGLGLPLCINFMKLHGGNITVQSELGKGATVTARFPAKRTIAS